MFRVAYWSQFLYPEDVQQFADLERLNAELVRWFFLRSGRCQSGMCFLVIFQVLVKACNFRGAGVCVCVRARACVFNMYIYIYICNPDCVVCVRVFVCLSILACIRLGLGLCLPAPKDGAWHLGSSNPKRICRLVSGIFQLGVFPRLAVVPSVGCCNCCP